MRGEYAKKGRLEILWSMCMTVSSVCDDTMALSVV